MAIAVITIRSEDGEDDVNVSMEFEPKLNIKEGDDEPMPAAHYTAVRILGFLQEDVADEPGEVTST